VVTIEAVTAISWTGVLAFDSVVFSLTLCKAFTIGRGIRLLDVIVRDGASSSSFISAVDLIIYLRRHIFLVRAFLFVYR
jgi:hypothetical protein